MKSNRCIYKRCIALHFDEFNQLKMMYLFYINITKNKTLKIIKNNEIVC